LIGPALAKSRGGIFHTLRVYLRGRTGIHKASPKRAGHAKGNPKMLGNGSFGRRFSTQRSGSVGIIFAICTPVLVGTVGLCLDYGIASTAHHTMQQAADAGALAAARELSLSDSKRENVPAVVKSVVEAYVGADLKGSGAEKAAIRTVVKDSPLQVIVTLERSISRVFGGLFSMDEMSVEVTSVAQIMGMPNICLLALERTEPKALTVEKKSLLEGKSCAIFSDSSSAKGIAVESEAMLRASTICSAGGVDARSNGDVAPPPFTDCPHFDDPLEARQEPLVAGCTFTNLVIKNQVRTISPGVYCGGLEINGDSSVTALPGLYILAKGNLELKGNAVLKGRDVSFYFDAESKMTFDEKTAIDLEARTDGAMAGILFFGSRKQTADMRHEILSESAQKLVGTIYFPASTLVVGSGSEYGAGANVGSAAAYTAIVARRVIVQNKSMVTLNTDYNKTDVPVPAGIRGAGQPISLVK
jgi:hypothetical protein